jgi:hypothetical protein
MQSKLCNSRMHKAVLFPDMGLLWESAALLDACNTCTLDSRWDAYWVILTHAPENNITAPTMHVLYPLMY